MNYPRLPGVEGLAPSPLPSTPSPQPEVLSPIFTFRAGKEHLAREGVRAGKENEPVTSLTLSLLCLL